MRTLPPKTSQQQQMVTPFGVCHTQYKAKHYCSQGYCCCSCLNSVNKPGFYTTHKWHQLQSKAEVTERGSCGRHMIGIPLKVLRDYRFTHFQCKCMPENKNAQFRTAHIIR